MRVLVATLAVLLLVAICSLAEADLRVSRSAALSMNEDKRICCFTYIRQHIPRSMITSAFRTSSSCSMPAVVLVTRKGTQLCADPRATWVQKYLEEFREN